MYGRYRQVAHYWSLICHLSPSTLPIQYCCMPLWIQMVKVSFNTLLIDEKFGTPCKNYRPAASRCELMIRLVKANYGLSCESFHSSLLIERSQGLKTSAISAKLSWILMTIAFRVLYICVTFWLLAHKSRDLYQAATKIIAVTIWSN